MATSRRDLYASGLVPDRAPASVYVSVGLSGARQQEGSRRVAGSRFEEVTTALSAFPGVPGTDEPGSAVAPAAAAAADRRGGGLAADGGGLGRSASRVPALGGRRGPARGAGRAARRRPRRRNARGGARATSRRTSRSRPTRSSRSSSARSCRCRGASRTQTEAVSREKERLATLLSHLTAGVVALGEGGRVLLANPAAVALGGGRADAATVEDLFPGERDAPGPRGVLRATPAAPRSPPRSSRGAGERWRIVSVPLPLGGEGDRMAVIEDVSDVVRSNRLAAWAEMARIIAHEIKNPLTPIRLSVEHLREVWRRGSPDFDRVLEECVSNVLRQTEELRRSAAEFSDYARLPGPEKRPWTSPGRRARRRRPSRARRESAGPWTRRPGGGGRCGPAADRRVSLQPHRQRRGSARDRRRRDRASDRQRRSRARLRARRGRRPGRGARRSCRGCSSRTSRRAAEGPGLGLAIVKKIVEEHGGRDFGGESARGGCACVRSAPSGHRARSRGSGGAGR